MIRNYIIFTVSFFLSFVNFMIFYSFPFRLSELNVENSVAGLVVGSAACLTLVMRLVSGILIDRFRLPWAMFVTALLYCVAIALISTDSEVLVVSGRLALGALLGAMSTLLMYYSLIKSEGGTEKSRNVSLITFFNVLPTCLAPYVALKLTQLWGADSVTFIAFVLFTVCLILSFILDIQTRRGEVSDKSENITSLSGLVTLISNAELRIAAAILALVYVISGTTVTFLPSYLMSVGIEDPAPYFLMFTVSMMLPRLLLKRCMPSTARFPVVILGACTSLSVAGTLCNYLLAGTGNWYFAGAVLCGSALGIIYPAVMSYVVCSVSESLSGTSSSMVAAAADSGIILSNIALGVVGMTLGLKPVMLLPILASCMALLLLIAKAALLSINKKEISA